MAESMHAPSGSNGKILPSEFMDSTILPALYQRLNTVFPEFDWQLKGSHWIAGRACSDEITGRFGRHDRIVCKQTKPYGFAAAGGDNCTWLMYITGSSSSLKGEDYINAVVRLGELASVDCSPITAKKVSQEQREQWVEQQRKRALEAEENLCIAREKEAQENTQAIKAARTLIKRAVAESAEPKAMKSALAYFEKRGIKIEKMAGGRLPSPSVYYTADMGFKGKGKGTGGIVIPVFDVDNFPIGAQRIFITKRGVKVHAPINGENPSKATIGRPRGGSARIGEGFPDDVLVLCEGYENGLAVHQATGWTVWPCISAEPMSMVQIPEQIRARLKAVIIAGDLDKSLAGQKYAVAAAERVRNEYQIPSIPLLPVPKHAPSLFDSDAMPRNNAKSVDWLDVLNESGDDAVNDAFSDCLRDIPPIPKEESAPFDDAPPPPDGIDDLQGGDPNEPLDPRDLTLPGWPEPRGPVMPRNHHDQALLFLADKFGLIETLEEGKMASSTSALRLVLVDERLYRFDAGVYYELGSPSVMRGEVRRWSRPFCEQKRTRESPPRKYYVSCDLSSQAINAILTAAADEALVVTPPDDYQTQYWMTDNINRYGKVTTFTPAWHRRIEHPERNDLPDPELVLSVRNGLVDLDIWKKRRELVLMDHTPRFFTSSIVDIEIPIADAIHALDERGVQSLREYAESLCPEWCEFLSGTFADEDDADAAPTTIREVHKVIGNYLTADLSRQEGNIAWLHGPPGTGKSTIKNVIESVLGAKNVVSSSMFKLSNNFHMGSWLGKRLAIFADLDQSGKTDKKANVELFKMIAGGDAISVDRKHRDEIPNFLLRTRILCLVNAMPQMPDATNSLQRRSICFDFKNIPETRDQTLGDKLVSPTSLAGIMLLAICGLADLVDDGGFKQPKWSSEPLEILAAQSSDYVDFIEQCIEPTNDWKLSEDSNGWIGDHLATDDIHAAFSCYCDTIGRKYVPTKATLMAELINVLRMQGWKGISKSKHNKRFGYGGLKLTTAAQSMIDAKMAREGGSSEQQYTSPGFLPGE